VDAAKRWSERDLRAEMRPVVEAQIIRPHFERMNAQWRDAVVPAVSDAAGKAASALQKLAAIDGDRAETWTGTLANVRKIASLVGSVSFTPPSDADWWQTRASKDATFNGMEAEVNGPIRAALGKCVDVAAMQRVVQDALAVQQSQIKVLRDQQTRLEESYRSQADVLAGLGDPFKFLAADLAYVPRFPLLLGGLLAAGAIMSSRAAAGFINAGSHAGQAPIEMLDGLGFWTASTSAAVALRLVAGLAWVGVAAWQLRHWPGDDASHVIEYAAIGAGAVALSELWRARVLRRAVQKARQPSPGPSPELAPQAAWKGRQ
jgi:hypothetical protein